MKHQTNPPRLLLASAAFIASMLLFASTAHALTMTMTFDGTVTGGVEIIEPAIPFPHMEDGLRLRFSDDDTIFPNAFADSNGGGRTDRPTDYFMWASGCEVVLETVSGNPFSLTSFQFGNAIPDEFFGLTVTGIGGNAIDKITITNVLSMTSNDWATHHLSGAWTNLQSVVFKAPLFPADVPVPDFEGASRAAIDTIVVNGASVPDSGSVPIPDSGSALTMLGCGILSLAWLRRKLG